jgi:Holliday junction DNA helicase RuvB
MFTYLDKTGANHKIMIDDLTFIGATTHPQDLIDTLKDRCVKLELEFYDNDELQKIFLGKFVALNLEIDSEALAECINRCRSSLREVNFIVKGIKTYAVNANTDSVDLELAHEYFKVADLAPLGLKAMDIEILNALSEDAAGILAEDAIAARVGIDVKVYSYEHEPYLERIGFITRTSRGRSLTDKARDYLKDGVCSFETPENELNPPIDTTPTHEIEE